MRGGPAGSAGEAVAMQDNNRGNRAPADDDPGWVLARKGEQSLGLPESGCIAGVPEAFILVVGIFAVTRCNRI